MIQLIINNQETPLISVWYHYKEPSSRQLFHLKIPLDFKEVIKTIEDYAKCSVTSENLNDKVLIEDKHRLSMGLLWHLLNQFDKMGIRNEQKVEHYWTLNNIIRIEVNESVLTIIGEFDR